MDENKLEQIYQLIERRYEEGYRDGEQAALGKLVSKLEVTYPREPKTKRARRPETRPRLKNPAETLAAPITNLLTMLARSEPDGVEPAILTEHLVSSGIEVDIRQIRVALRQLTLDGRVLRVARGRYLPAENAASAPIAAD